MLFLQFGDGNGLVHRHMRTWQCAIYVFVDAAVQSSLRGMNVKSANWATGATCADPAQDASMGNAMLILASIC